MSHRFAFLPVLVLLVLFSLPQCFAFFRSRTDSVSSSQIPPPWQDPDGICRPHRSSKQTFVCDPSGLLSGRETDKLDAILTRLYNGYRPYSLISCKGREKDQAGFRVAVAVVRRMSFDSNTLSQRAAVFAHNLFKRWDMNDNCGASVLLFLSLEDKRMYIQTGQFAVAYLSEKDIDTVYAKMTPYLKKNRLADSLAAAVKRIAAYLSKYHGAHPGSVNAKGEPSGISVPLYFRNGPAWWDLELSIIAAITAALAVVACCNGIGGTEATRVKREKRHILRKLNIVRAEYVAASLPRYLPATCPMCHDDLTPPWVPTIPTLPDTEALVDVPAAPTRPVRTLACGHAFHEACFDDEHPIPSGTIPACPVCGAVGGGAASVSPLSATRGQDALFRVSKLHDEYPHILTDAVVAKLNSVTPDAWPETMTEAYLTPEHGGNTGLRGIRTAPGHSGGGGFWSGLGGLLAIGGIGAAVASMFGGWGNRDNQSYTSIPSDGGGGHVAQWFGGGGNATSGGGHGTGWGDSVNSAVSHVTGSDGGGGHGTSWGDALGNAASHVSGWGGGGGDGGSGGHGSGW